MEQLFSAVNSLNLLSSYQNWGPIVTETNCCCCCCWNTATGEVKPRVFLAAGEFLLLLPANFTKRGHWNLKSSIYALTSVPMCGFFHHCNWKPCCSVTVTKQHWTVESHPCGNNATQDTTETRGLGSSHPALAIGWSAMVFPGCFQ